MTQNRESVSAQSKRRTNYLLLVFGLVIAVLFLLAWCRMQPKKERQVVPKSSQDYTLTDFDGNTIDEAGLTNLSSRGDAQLVVIPPEMVMSPNVVIGSEAEAPITLRAENAPILLNSKDLAEQQEDGFVLSGSCMNKERLEKDEECIIKVQWAPKTLRNIQNTLVIRWREHNPAVFKIERTNVILKAQSTDSKDCVICEDIRKEAEKIPQKVIDSKGNIRELQPDEKEKFKDNYYVDPETGEIFIKEPDRIPLDLKNEVIGTVAENHDVIGFNGKKIGRLLGDDTIIDPTKGTVIGKAIPLVSVMNEHGHVFGKMIVSGNTVSAVDSKGKVVGFPRVDGQVVDEKNNAVGFISPWGSVIDSMGEFLGVILPNGNVVKGTQKVATMRPMGFAVNDQGELIGGVVPRGIGVGAGGRPLGEINLIGEVKDSFDQIVARVLLDGAIVDAEMNELGATVRQGIIVDEIGHPIGYVNSEGKALDFKATQIGVVNPDGTAFANKRFVGTVMPEGQITKGGCSYAGSVYPDGSVVNLTLKTVGHITPEGKAVTDKKEDLGSVVPWGTAIAPGCRLLGLVSLNGSVVSTDGVRTGCVNPDKTVQNLQGESVGEVTPLGLYINAQNQVVGRVRLDGQIMDNKGIVIGCIYEKKSEIFSFNNRGTIIDENGYSLGRSSIGNKAYDENGNWIGEVYFNGWVIGDKGQLIGVVPFTGTVFSDEGKPLGYYNQLTGSLKDRKGANLGRVLPGLSVINPTGTEILGKLIPEGTTFMKLDGSFLGTLNSNGVLIGSDLSVTYKIHADGTVTDQEGNLVGMNIPTGPVLSDNGKYVAFVNNRGEVLDNRQMKIGHVLTNGLAISEKNQILGQVFPGLSGAVSVKGFIGSIEPKMSGIAGDMAYQVQVNDTKGNLAGIVSGTGVVLGTDNAVSGRLVPIAPFVNSDGKLLGWGNFQGEVNTPDGRSFASVLPSGGALDTSHNLVGSVVKSGVVVDPMGSYLGYVGSKGKLLSSKGEELAVVTEGNFLYNTDGAIIGQILSPGIAVDLNSQLMGWTRADGQIENGAKVLGQVGLDGHVFDVNGQMIGRYVPLGATAFNDSGKSVGFIGGLGEVIDASGLTVARMGYEPYLANKGIIIGREKSASPFVTSLENGNILGMVDEDASVLPLKSDRPIGSVMMNREFMNTSNKFEGEMIPGGLAITPTLGLIGTVSSSGQIDKASRKVGLVTGSGLVYSPVGELIGGIFSPGVLIDKKGMFVGTTSGTAGVVKNGNQIGNKMAFGSALSTANDWLGNIMPSGGIVDDIGQYYGVVATTDGSIVGDKGTFAGRILPDGSAAGVPEKAVFNTMPYVGHIVRQGIPVGLNKDFKIVGQTTVMGDIINAASKKLFRITDNAYVVNKTGQEPPVIARVLPVISAVDNNGKVLGISTSEGTIVSYRGEAKGRIDNAGFVRSMETKSTEDEMRIQGLLIPEGLVVNNCKIVGQTAYDGRVINGQGSVVGRIARDLWAVDVNGEKIGRVVRNNEPCISGKQLIGRTLPDSMVVDLNGVEIGCATNSGEMLGPNGEKLCTVVERGIIVDKDGKIIGWTRADGTIYDGTTSIGQVDEDGIAYDWKGNQMGMNIGGSKAIFTNEDGTVKYVQDGTDLVTDSHGDPIFKVPPTGSVMDPWNNPLPGLNPYVSGIGYLQGCDLLGYDGQKIASLMADGTLRDENGNLVYTVMPDGQIFEPNGNYVESFKGIDISLALKQCGLSGSSKASSGRQILVGNRILTVDPNGSLVDEDGMIIGYLGEDGRPYTLGSKLITGGNLDGRERPDTAQKFKPTQAQRDDFVDKLDKRRKGMKAEFGRGILTISAEIEARAKPKKDKDWAKLGIQKSVSTWPVDMTHVILQGKAIPAVLARSIDSRYSGVPVIAIVETNIYGEEGRNILIPAGSRLIGTFGGDAGDQQNGVAKLQIAWNRLIRPDGSAFNLNSAQSGDAQGRGGVAAYLDEQLWNKYGSSVLSTLASSAVSYMLATNEEITASGSGQYSGSGRSVAMAEGRQQFIEKIGDILDDMISRAAQTPPVIFVPSGTRLTVFPSQDLWLRSPEDDVEDLNNEYGAASTSAQVPQNVGSWTEKRRSEQEETSSGSSLNDQKETETPLYDGTDHMPDISDRKVEPVVVEEEPLF